MTGLRLVVPSGDSLLLVPKAPDLGQPLARPLEFNDPIPELDDLNVGYACTARPLGADLACGSLLEACEAARRTVDEKAWRTSVIGRPFPPPAGTCLDQAFRTVHPDYVPVPTDAKYYEEETLGFRKAREQLSTLRARTLQCAECQRELAAEPLQLKQEQPESKAAAAAPKESRKHRTKADAIGKAKKDAVGKAKAQPRADAKFHSCLKDGTGGSAILGEREFTEPKRLRNSIFTANGTRNNLLQMLRLARESDLHRLQLRSLVASTAMHAWLTINSRWLRYSPERADGFDAAKPPYLALIFRGRDLRHPEALLEVKEFKALLDVDHDLLELATKVPLSLFIVAVCHHVETAHAQKVRLPTGDPAFVGVDAHSGLLFGGDLKSIAKEVEAWMNIHADMFSRWSWVLQSTRALFAGWEAAEKKVAGDHSVKYHETVAVQERSTGYMVCPPGSGGALCRYQKLGGCTYAAVQTHALAAGHGWFYTGYLPLYAASLHLRPDRPPLSTDRFYYNSESTVPFTLLHVLRWEAYMATSGKYADTEAAKSLSKEVLSDRLNKLARPDDVSVLRMRFSYVNAKAKSTSSTDKRPRVIPTPSLLSKPMRLPWQDPNEASLEHLLPEYFAHCVKHFAPADAGGDAGEVKAASFFQKFVSDPENSEAFIKRLPDVDVAGGQVPNKSRQTLREIYAHFLTTAARLGCVARTIGLLAANHGVEYQDLVDSARLFRAQALAAASRVHVDYGSSGKFGVHVMRSKFLAAECKLRLQVPVRDASEHNMAMQFSVAAARAEELLIQALLNPGVPLEALRIENGTVAFEDMKTLGITGMLFVCCSRVIVNSCCACVGTVGFLDRGAMYMTELAGVLLERFEQWERTIGSTLYTWLTSPAQVVRVEPRWRDSTPVMTAGWLPSLHLYRIAIASLAPRAVLAELSAAPASTHARIFAEALVADNEGVPATLKGFWAAATKEGCRNEIAAAARAVLAPPPSQVPAPAAVPAKPAPAVAAADATEAKIKRAIQFHKQLPPLKLSDFLKGLAAELFISGAGNLSIAECYGRISSFDKEATAAQLRVARVASGGSSGKEEKKQQQGTKRPRDTGGAGASSGESASKKPRLGGAAAAAATDDEDDDQDMAKEVAKAFEFTT